MHGQLLILGIHGTELSAAEATLYKSIQPGGFILFGRNIESAAQTRKLTDDLRELCDITPIICIDQEGGRVSRTRHIGSEPPSAESLRDKGDPGLIAQHGKLTAFLLRLLGCNMDLCPVLDIAYDDHPSDALRGRCYGRDSQEVITNAGIFNSNLRHCKVLSCGKHFPSCGLATDDPHHKLPQVGKSIGDMLKSDLLPYTCLMPELDAIMSCHTHFSAVDPDEPDLPASMSHKLLTGLLRNQLGYEGVIMTDDLDMGAIINHFGRGPDVQKAIQAGNDMVMICHQIDTAELALQHLKELPHARMDDSLRRIEKLKKKAYKPLAYSDELWDTINADIMKLRIDVLGECGEGQDDDPDYTPSPVEDY